jgi:putative DNA primase/helicase
VAEACNEILGETTYEGKTSPQNTVAKAAKKPNWTPAEPTKYTPAPEIRHFKLGKPSATWAYHNAQGVAVSYVCRFDTPQGKEIMPYTYASNSETGEMGWRWLGLGTPRPLYDLHLLQGEQPVLIVEGEKCAEAAKRFFPGLSVTTWIGGARNIRHTDWSAIYGRKVIIWPDHDEAGTEAATAIFDLLKAHVPSVRYVRNPADAPRKWDIADAQWTAEEAQAYLKANLYAAYEPEPDTPEPTPEPQPQPENKHEAWEGCVDFRPLGYGRTDNGPVFYFYSIRAGLIVPLSPSSLSKSNLLGLAELNYWERAFPSNSKRANIDWDAAQDFLISACMDKGFFDPFSIRGRGAWLDDGRIVVHSGDKLIVDGVPMPIHKLKSKFVYEAALPLDIATANPLKAREAAALLDALKFCNWSRNANGVLLAGWCVIAPVCGALKWRPHIWLTGAADSGKTWIYREIVAPILGAPALRVQSATTAAGLRALLNTDGRPVVFEEAEQTSQTSAARIAEVMELIRASSADDSGAIAKGSVTGAPRQYVMRACFAMASINVPITEPSDARRFTILSAASVRNQERRSAHFKELQAKVLKVTTKEFRERLQARTLAMLPTILANLETFKAVTSAVLGRTAYGDQLAPMLAGAYALEYDGLVTLEAAKAYVESLDWSEEKALDTTRDEMACLNHLLETMVQVESSMGKLERNIGELLFAARGVVYPVHVAPPDDGVTPYNADARLRRLGIKIEMIDGHPYMVVSNSSKDIKAFFKGKENWSANHGAILKRIEGAKTVGSTTFSPAIKSRAVAIPMDLLEN